MFDQLKLIKLIPDVPDATKDTLLVSTGVLLGSNEENNEDNPAAVTVGRDVDLCNGAVEENLTELGFIFTVGVMPTALIGGHGAGIIFKIDGFLSNSMFTFFEPD